MCATATRTDLTLTPEDLLAMTDEKDFELVDGQLVERVVSALSSWISGELLILIGMFLREHPIGRVWPADNGFQCFPDDPNKVRKPDISFIRRERMSVEIMRQGWVRVFPDLVVEVISPNENGYEIQSKISEYLGAGVSLIWVIYPETREVMVYRADFSASLLTAKDELTGESVLPGFAIPLQSLFSAIPDSPVVS